jgi:hypothetical protein
MNDEAVLGCSIDAMPCALQQLVVEGESGKEAARYLVEWRIAWTHPDGSRRQLERGQEATSFEKVRQIADSRQGEAIGREFYVSEVLLGQRRRSVCANACEIVAWTELPPEGASIQVSWPDETRRETARSRIFQTIANALNEAMSLRLVPRRRSRELTRAMRTMLMKY